MYHCPPPYPDPYFAALISAGEWMEMERDDDYLRELLQGFEASDSWMHSSTLTLAGEAERFKRHFHILLLVDAGLMAPMREVPGAFRITNSGHDFLALTRQNDAWEATKAAVRNLRGASVQMLLRVAEGYAMARLREMGVPLE